MESSEIPISEPSITLTHQEKEVPESNLINNFNKLFYFLRLVTHKSAIKGTEQSVERPISERTNRAQLLKTFKSIPKSDEEGRINVLSEANDRDEIAKQYLNQGEFKINIPGLGEQLARYTIIEPPKSRISKTNIKPPIFLIPGISNDIDCVGALAQEIPFMGRKVVVVGMPESQMGKVTSEFAQSVINSTYFSTHSEFFKGAINTLVGKNQQVELWGHSTGSAIIEEILNDPEFQKRTSNAVLLCPASSSNMTKNTLNLGVFNELRNLISRNLPKYTLSSGKDSREEQKRLKSEIFQSMLKKVCTKTESWKKSRVKEGGKIIVYSGEKDSMTRSFETFNDDPESKVKIQQENPQIEVIDAKNGFHTTPLIEPQKVIKEVFAVQDNIRLIK